MWPRLRAALGGIHPALSIGALVCVVIVLGIGAVSYPGFLAAQKHISRGRVRLLDGGLSLFLQHQRRCPTTRDELVTLRYIDPGVLTDTWGTSIAYCCSPHDLHVRSAGRDQTFQTLDDITNE